MGRRGKHKNGGQLRDMIVNLEELKDVELFVDADELRKEREAKEKQKRKQREKRYEARIRREQGEMEAVKKAHIDGRETMKVDALTRLSQLKDDLNKAPIGTMSISYDKNHVLERISIKQEEFVPYMRGEFTGLMKVIKGTREPLYEVSIEELLREYGDEDVVNDLYGKPKS